MKRICPLCGHSVRLLAILKVVPPGLVPELEQVLTREIVNDDVSGMRVRYALPDDIERISGSANERLSAEERVAALNLPLASLDRESVRLSESR